MHGNYRHQYLLSSAAGSQSATEVASLPSEQPVKSRQQQQMASNFNGLPTAAANGKQRQQQVSANNYPMASTKHHQELQASDRLINSQRSDANGRYFSEQHPLQLQVLAAGRNEYCSQSNGSGSIREQANQRARHERQSAHTAHMSNDNHTGTTTDHPNQPQPQYQHRHQHQQTSSRQRSEYLQQSDEIYYDGETNRMSNGPPPPPAHNRDHYASQLRNSKMQHNFQQQYHNHNHQHQANQPTGRQFSQQHQARGPTSGAHPAHGSNSHPQPGQTVDRGHRDQSPPSQSTSSQQQHYRKGQAAPAADRSLHVNFNRANQAAGPDEDEGDTRKKKYLTAKYGQQQMNLIKKRLKIEMWLCEQLKELASGSKSEAELEEIDIDLDQLLDMDDDDTRRRWLKKTLEPFDDIQSDRIDKFIGDVLEQSKLL